MSDADDGKSRIARANRRVALVLGLIALALYGFVIAQYVNR